MVEEDPVLNGSGIELAIFTQVQVHLSLRVRLTGGVESVHVGLVLLDANHGVHERCGQEAEYGQNQRGQRQHSHVADASDAPAFTPSR